MTHIRIELPESQIQKAEIQPGDEEGSYTVEIKYATQLDTPLEPGDVVTAVIHEATADTEPYDVKPEHAAARQAEAKARKEARAGDRARGRERAKEAADERARHEEGEGADD